MNTKAQDNVDLIWGTREIGEFLGVHQVKAFRLLRAGEIPGKFMGGRWVARRSELDAFFRFAKK